MTESWHSDEVMPKPMVNKVLLLIKSPPCKGGIAAEGLRMATAMIAMDVLPQILFVDDGVFWLTRKQKPETTGAASPEDRLKTISDLVGLHVLVDSLVPRKLKQDDLNENLNLKTLSLDNAAELLAENDAVITF